MKPTFILLTSLGLLLICTHVLHGQCQQQPHSAPAIPAQGKQPLPKAGILRRLTRTEADIDGPGAGGHPARIVFIVTPSTDCKTISVGKAVTVVYASSGTRNIAVSITEVKPPPDPDVGAVGGIAEVQPISNAADGQSTPDCVHGSNARGGRALQPRHPSRRSGILSLLQPLQGPPPPTFGQRGGDPALRGRALIATPFADW
jgi:hypothetical protein